MNYTFIIPFYNEDQNVHTLNDEIIKNIKKINDGKRGFQIIYVDDGSDDNTFEELKKLNSNNVDTTIIRHRINMSQSAALNTGINHSKYENLVILDGDQQNDPEDIGKMINEFEKGFDMIIGWRKNRKDNFFLRSIPSIVANFVVRLFSKSKIHDHGCAFKVVKKNTIDELTNWGDFHRLLAARLANNGYKVKEIEVNHKRRIYGRSNYGFSRILKVLIDLLYLKFFNNYRRQSIYFFGLFSFFSFLFSGLCFVYMIVLKFAYNTSFIQTPLPILIIFLIMVGLIFLFIGILAQLIMNQDKSSDKIKDSISKYSFIKPPYTFKSMTVN